MFPRRGKPGESLADLMERLIDLSESRPSDLNQLMPPNISGLVCNQTTASAQNKKPVTRYFDVQKILSPSNLFKVNVQPRSCYVLSAFFLLLISVLHAFHFRLKTTGFIT